MKEAGLTSNDMGSPALMVVDGERSSQIGVFIGFQHGARSCFCGQYKINKKCPITAREAVTVLING